MTSLRIASDGAFVGWVFGAVADEESEEGPEDFEDAFDLLHGNGFFNGKQIFNSYIDLLI